MHSLRLPGVPPIPPSFKRHRFDSDPSRFSLNLSLSKPIPTPCWASLPSPPMSGSPPPEHPIEPPQAAGRRRKRSDTPNRDAPSPISTPVVITATIVSETRLERRGDVPATTGISIPPTTRLTAYPVPQSYGFSAGPPVLSGPATSSFPAQYAAGPSSPKSTRKSKVHVPSACVNCKKKHLRCDNSRPCHRCVQLGKEDSCVDVQHKKRGRPPLKHDDSAARRYQEPETGTEAERLRDSFHRASQSETQLYPYPYHRQPIAPRDPLQQSLSRPGENPILRMPLAPSPFGMYAPPSVSSSYATASGTTYQPSASRPPSSSSSLPSSQPPSPYYQTPSVGTSPEGALRGVARYGGGYDRQPPMQELYPSSASPYHVSLFPRPVAQQQQPQQQPQQQTPFEVNPSAYTPQQSMAPELQLPPIRPAPPGASTNPAMAQQQQRQAQHQQQQQQQQGRESRAGGRHDDNGTREPDPKRPKMSLGDIVHPRDD